MKEKDKMLQSPGELTFTACSFSSEDKIQDCECTRLASFTTEFPGMGSEKSENPYPSWQAGRQSIVQVQTLCRGGLGQW